MKKSKGQTVDLLYKNKQEVNKKGKSNKTTRANNVSARKRKYKKKQKN